MSLTDYGYQAGDSFSHATAEGYKQANKYWGIPGAASGAGQYISDNKIKSILFPAAVASTVFTAMHVKAGYISAAEASGFLAKTSDYFVGINRAMAASLPEFIGTGVAGQIVAGLIMAIATAAVAYGTYKAGSYLKDVAVNACSSENHK